MVEHVCDDRCFRGAMFRGKCLCGHDAELHVTHGEYYDSCCDICGGCCNPTSIVPFQLKRAKAGAE